jgi:hypothetical protein
MGHLVRACAVAKALLPEAEPIIVSMAPGIADVGAALGIRTEYIPGRDREWMPRRVWDHYLRDRLIALAEETGAKVISFDGVVPYPGVLAAKFHSADLRLAWVRRGLWRDTPQKLTLSLYASLMDKVIEPGDYAAEYDKGPTSGRNDAEKVAPVSLYSADEACPRDEARQILGLDLDRPAVLVTLGTATLEEIDRLKAVLRGLKRWTNVQVLMTKNPVDRSGESIVPPGLDLRTARYFPLAKLLPAFDGAISAAGYNSIHEFMCAGTPTIFIPVMRGTDDQLARAKWCHDFGFAIMADPENLLGIERWAERLSDVNIRNSLSTKCLELSDPSGGIEIAQKLLDLSQSPAKHGVVVTYSYWRFRLSKIRRSTLRGILKQSYYAIARAVLRNAALIYRKIVPRKIVNIMPDKTITFSQTLDPKVLKAAISSAGRFEHILDGSSNMYKSVRKKIAAKAYGPLAVSESTWLVAQKEIAQVEPPAIQEIQLQTEEVTQVIAQKQGDYLPQ